MCVCVCLFASVYVCVCVWNYISEDALSDQWINWIDLVVTNFYFFFVLSTLCTLQPREKGRMRVHMLQNAQIALNFLKFRKVRFDQLCTRCPVFDSSFTLLSILYSTLACSAFRTLNVHFTFFYCGWCIHCLSHSHSLFLSHLSVLICPVTHPQPDCLISFFSFLPPKQNCQ